ncbi:MAG: hypothetical protein A3G18_03465 [Rhodospirillales bacterium RIFCSPLOWO2_12_FULL_58_28]|nr:MAG: hypothetical protein A3G18_03465 [Rhodospirillales bacterium RIFCSPLOWO2_12_FULL_58_28]
MNAAIGLHRAGRLQEAEAVYKALLEKDPSNAEALHYLGLIAHQIGRNDLAAELIGKSLAIDDRQAVHHYNFGEVLRALGRVDQAVAAYRRVLEINPQSAEAHNSIGVVLEEQGRGGEAVESYRRSLALNPGYAEAHFNLGNALRGIGCTDEAIASYRLALGINPAYAAAHTNLGVALESQNRIDEAIQSYLRAPDFANALNNLGVARQKQGRLEEAIASYRRALEIDPAFAEALSNLGSVLGDKGLVSESIACFRRALEIDPSFAAAHSNVIFNQFYDPSVDMAGQQDERRRWNERFALPLASRIKPHANSRVPHRRLRIGYVSADFKRHSACQGFAPLIIDHDRSRFDVVCYVGNSATDAMTETLRAAVALWRPVFGMADGDLAEVIRNDGIDILVDLSGHTNGNRLLVFAEKPAPVQVTGIGDMAPGLSAIDYRITMPAYTRPEEEHLFPEKPIYMRTCFGFAPPAAAPPVVPPPCLESGAVTFGCLNRFSKVSDDALSLWAGILHDVDGARLLIKYGQMDEPAIRRRVIDFFSGEGIAEDRLILLGRTPQPEHLKTYGRVDIALDTFPQGGGMTTLESLWMGVPVVGFADDVKIDSRMIRVFCEPLGLHDWVAAGADEYRQIAVIMAGRTDMLAELRRELRGRVLDLYSGFVKDMERAYGVIWKRWCDGEKPSPLHIAGD